MHIYSKILKDDHVLMVLKLHERRENDYKIAENGEPGQWAGGTKE